VDAGDPDFTEYFRTIERQVRAVWQFPPELQGTTQTVKLGFALRLDGTLEEARVLSSTSAVLDESAQSAMRRATPFPPLPLKFRALAGQPLVMSFTVTVR
jgi:TonB family protein